MGKMIFELLKWESTRGNGQQKYAEIESFPQCKEQILRAN